MREVGVGWSSAAEVVVFVVVVVVVDDSGATLVVGGRPSLVVPPVVVDSTIVMPSMTGTEVAVVVTENEVRGVGTAVNDKVLRDGDTAVTFESDDDEVVGSTSAEGGGCNGMHTMLGNKGDCLGRCTNTISSDDKTQTNAAPLRGEERGGAHENGRSPSRCE